MGLKDTDIEQLYRAGLVHDIGKTSVRCGALERWSQPSSQDLEQIHLHPYYTERILSRVGQLQALASDSAAHHEWINGQGYHKRITGEVIPLKGRILAVADAYAYLAIQQHQEVDPEAVLKQMQPSVGAQFDGPSYQALIDSLQGPPSRKPALRPASSAGLTEREVEVIRLLARGYSYKKIASELVISEKTVEHHLGHIYGKLNVTCRTSAVVFAVHNGLAD